MSKVTDRLKNAVESRHEIEKNDKMINSTEFVLDLKIDSLEEKKYLEQKSIEVLNTQAKASLELGEIFEEVFQKIEDRTYCSWLEELGYNRMTASRHRKRYSLYSEVKGIRTKEIIASLTFRELDKVSKEPETYLELMETSNLKDFKNFLKNETQKPTIRESSFFSFKKMNIKKYSNQINKLDPKETDQAILEVEELEKNLKEIKKLLMEKTKEINY